MTTSFSPSSTDQTETNITRNLIGREDIHQTGPLAVENTLLNPAILDTNMTLAKDQGVASTISSDVSKASSIVETSGTHPHLSQVGAITSTDHAQYKSHSRTNSVTHAQKLVVHSGSTLAQFPVSKSMHASQYSPLQKQVTSTLSQHASGNFVESHVSIVAKEETASLQQVVSVGSSVPTNSEPMNITKAPSHNHQQPKFVEVKYSTWGEQNLSSKHFASSPSTAGTPSPQGRHTRSASAAESSIRNTIANFPGPTQGHQSSSSTSASFVPTIPGNGQPIFMSPLREESGHPISSTPLSSKPPSISRKNNSFMKGGLSSASLGPLSSTTGSIMSGTGGIGTGRRSATRNQAKSEREVLVGTPVKEGHANYMLMYDMLTGIRISVSRCNAKLPRDLEAEDFHASHKLAFDVTGNELTPSSKYDFKFKDYAPWVFRSIRELFHVDPAEYLLSLTGKYVLSELGSPGKSGSFFYFSQDYRFIIKTIHHSEHKFIMKILKHYYDHIRANPHTLISRIFGLHRVKLPGKRKIHFVVMGNVFPPHKDIHEIYDLKGSTIGRSIPDEEARRNPRAVMKDLNWVERGRQLHLGPERRKLLIEQMERDVDFLMRLEIMDYSFLVGLHDVVKGNKDNIRDQTLSMIEPNPETMARRTTRLSRANNIPKSKPGTIEETTSLGGVSLNAASSRFSENAPPERRYCIFYQDEGGFQATDETNFPLKEIYYIGIIDIFTKYSLAKKIENFFKGMSADKQNISAIPPDAYGLRFLDFMKNAISGYVKTGVSTNSVTNIEIPAASAPIAVPGSSSSTPMSTQSNNGGTGSVPGEAGVTPSSSFYGSYTASISGGQGHSTQASSEQPAVYGSAPAAIMLNGVMADESPHPLPKTQIDTTDMKESGSAHQKSTSNSASENMNARLDSSSSSAPHVTAFTLPSQPILSSELISSTQHPQTGPHVPDSHNGGTFLTPHASRPPETELKRGSNDSFPA